MASKSTTAPDTPEREAPGDTSTNPSGALSDEPAEGADDAPEKQEG